MSRLDAGLTRIMTLVVAPTGFGKTTLVSLWLASRNIPAAWVTLEKSDNDPVRFWSYVVTAIRTVKNSLGKTSLGVLMSSQPPAFEMILTPLLNDLSRFTQPFVLVLDDYHVIDTTEIHEGVTFLLRHLSETLHVILISRNEPELPLGILRARDNLVEIDADHLRFTPVETAAFLREAIRGDMPDSAVAKLQEQTEGWAAGLRLAASSLQGRGIQDAEKYIQNFSGSHRYVSDYLIQEVFQRLPEKAQTFLLKTCFLTRLTQSLCDAVMDESDGGTGLLEQIARENLFIVQLEPRGGRVWYRYTPLFAESIQTLARQRFGEAGIQSIFEKARVWYEYHQFYDEAIDASLAARQYDRALDLIEKFIEIYNLNELYTLTRWMEKIPLALTFQHPVICMGYAQVILFTSDRYAPMTATRIEPYLQAAELAWQAQGDEAKIGTVLALRGMMLLWLGEFHKSLYATYLALEKMAEGEIFWRGVSLLNAAGGDLYGGRIMNAQDKILEARALLGATQNIYGMLAATGMMSEIFYAQGDMELCVQLNEQVLAEAVGDESMKDDQGEARLRLSHIAYEQNDLETAERHGGEALDLAKQRANELLQAQALVRLAFILATKGRLTEAQVELKNLLASLQNAPAVREVKAALARLALLAGEPETLGWWTNGIDDDPNVLYLQREREAFILARLRIAENKPVEALALLEKFRIDADEQGRVRSQVEALCLEALAHEANGDFLEAREALTEALIIGQPKGFRRLFLDEGGAFAKLLQKTIPAIGKRSLSLYATTLLHSFPPEMVSPDTAGRFVLVEPLSQQETRVLRLLVAGLSNGEIAQKLVVSTNTVKTQVKSIYRKLNIRSRGEAREVARELNLR